MTTAERGAGDGFEEFCREEFNPAEVFSKPEALKGYRVLSCTQYILGPSCASYLGELGAEVIKIEQPRAGEPMRHTTPWNEPSLYPLSRWLPERGTGLGFFGANFNEYFIWLADYWGGMMQAVHILAALHWRDTLSGEGAFLEYSQVDGVTRQLEWSLPVYGRYGVVRQRWGNWDTELAVHGIIRCGRSSYPESDNPQEQEEGYLLVTAYEDADFARLCGATGLQDLAAKYPDLDARVPPDAQREIYAALEAWASDKTKEDAARVLDDNDVLNQPVWNAKEVAEHPHWRERGSIQWLDDQTFGDVLAQGPAYKLSETPPRLKSAFKPVSADNKYIYTKLTKLNKSEIERLQKKEVI